MLFFNCVHGLVGAGFDGRYTACGKFDQDQQVYVAKSGLSSHSCSSVSSLEANMSHVCLASGSSG